MTNDVTTKDWVFHTLYSKPWNLSQLKLKRSPNRLKANLTLIR